MSIKMIRMLAVATVLLMDVIVPVMSLAQGTDEHVKVEIPGTLIDLVTDLESSRIHSLKVEGRLNAADLSYIGGSAGKIATVKELDLSDISLVPGPEPYKTYSLRENTDVLGNTTATFFISDTDWIESTIVDTALGGYNTLQNVYGKNLAGLFAGCKFEKVILPTNMSNLGYASFFEAEGIKEVVLPSELQEIDRDAFYSATTLTQVSLPSTLKKIGYDSFSKTGLTNVSLPTSLDSICDRAFRQTPLAQIDLQNVEYVGEDCFSGCKLEGTLNLTNLNSISDGAFSSNAITSIMFGSQLTEIGAKAFSSNRELTALYLPEGLQKIGEEAFYDCTKLSDVVLPSSLEDIGYKAFENTEWNNNLKGDNGVVYLNNIAYAYDYNSASDPAVLKFREGTTSISPSFDLSSFLVADEWCRPYEYITTIIFPSTLKRIESRTNYGDGIFGNMENLGDIVFNEGLEYIGDYAFYGCKKLWFDKFPSSLEHIGNYAFSYCDGLTEVTIPSSVQYLGDSSFFKCGGVSTVKYQADPSYVGEEVFSYNNGLCKATIGKNVKEIPNSMFIGSSLQKLEFEAMEERTSALSLGISCFEKTQLTKVILPEIDVWNYHAFNNCPQLESIEIIGDCKTIETECMVSNTIQSVAVQGRINKINSNAFGKYQRWGFHNSMSSFSASRCDTIGNGAFAANRLLEKVNIPEGVSHVGEGAFEYCESLSEFPFIAVKTIGAKSFANTNVKEVCFNEEIRIIPDNAFYDCQNLEKVTFSLPPIEVGDGAFGNCWNLSSFDFSQIQKIGADAFLQVGFKDMPELYLPDGFDSIGESAFYKTNLKSVSLPVSLLDIPKTVFKDASRFNLEWRIPEGYKYVGNKYNVIKNAVFASALTNSEVTVPEGVHEILNLAFFNNNLKSISFPSTLKLLFANALQKGEGGTVEKIYCNSPMPPYVDTYGLLNNWVDDIFDGEIYVPGASLDIYKNDDFWGKYNILPMPVEVDKISLNEDSITITQGDTYQLIANIEPSYATDKALMWKSSDENVATVSGDGRVTAVGVGTAEISVSASNGVQAKCIVTVEPKIVEMESIALNVVDLALEVGESYQLIANIEPSDATDKTLTWTSSDENVAIVSNDGRVTAVGVGTAEISVSASNGVQAKCIVTVDPKIVEMESITLNAVDLALEVGESYQLIANIEPSDATDKTLIWTSSDENVAIVSNDGRVTAVGVGTAEISVSASNGVQAKCIVTVEPKIIEMESITLNAEDLALEVGDSYQLIATIMPENSSNPELEWWSDDLSVANVDQNGLITVIGEGETRIHVRSVFWNNLEATCRLNAVMDVKSLIDDTEPCDVYSLSGVQLRKGIMVSEIDRLDKGVYIIVQGSSRYRIIR